MSEMDDLDDAIIEDTVHCTVCGASWVLGGDEEYMILDPPGDQIEAYEHGCQQVKLCVKCVDKIRSDLDIVEASRLTEEIRERDRLWLLLASAREALNKIVVTEGEDAGVILLSSESPTHYDKRIGCQVYDHDYFSDLGDALMALYRMLEGVEGANVQN